MIPRLLFGVLVLATFASSLVNQVIAVDGVPVERLDVSVNDLADVTGLDVYKYQVQVNAGQKLRAVLYLQNDKDSDPTKYLSREVTARKDGDAIFTASFLREDRKLASLFLSEEARMQFRFQWKGAASDGLSGNLRNPLANVPYGKKALTIHEVPKHRPDGSTELFLLFHTEHVEGQPLAVLYPQVSLRIEPLK